MSSESENVRALVIVPTYNERENIRRLIDTVLAQDGRLEMLVVDDGSPDGTGAIVNEIIRDERRASTSSTGAKLGLGTAYIAGFRWALERRYDYVLEMDADFSHDPAHLRSFSTPSSEADLVLGSRYREGKVTVVNWPIARLLLSYCANVYARAVTGLPVWDATGGSSAFADGARSRSTSIRCGPTATRSRSR